MYTKLFLLAICMLGMVLFPSAPAFDISPTSVPTTQPSITNGVWTPFQISQVSVSSEPIVGQVVTLSIDIISTEDEPAVTFSVDCLEEYRNQVRCLSGDKSWEGALMANQPKTFTLSIQVENEGEWPVEIRVTHRHGSGT